MPLVCCATGVGQSHGSPVLLRNSATDLALIDGITGSVHWTQPVQNPRKLAMFDVNGDGVDDVILRSEVDTYKENVTVLNGVTGSPLGGSKTLEYSGLVLGVISGCDFRAVLAVEGSATTFPDKLWLFDGSTFDTKSVYALIPTEPRGLPSPTFDGDGQNELAVAHNGLMSSLRLEPPSPGDTSECWLLLLLVSRNGCRAARW